VAKTNATPTHIEHRPSLHIPIAPLLENNVISTGAQRSGETPVFCFCTFAALR
jgi:hypothetical protein